MRVLDTTVDPDDLDDEDWFSTAKYVTIMMDVIAFGVLVWIMVIDRIEGDLIMIGFLAIMMGFALYAVWQQRKILRGERHKYLPGIDVNSPVFDWPFGERFGLYSAELVGIVTGTIVAGVILQDFLLAGLVLIYFAITQYGVYQRALITKRLLNQ